MQAITVQEAREKLPRLVDEADLRQPVMITGDRKNAVLIAEEDWSAIQETLHLLSIPGMRESILEGMDAPLEQCDKELDW